MPRLDQTLVDRGLAADLKEARAFVLAGKVLSGDTLLEDASAKIGAEAPLRLRGVKAQVSRAGAKLAAALEASGLPVEGRRCLDLGASTGGFTDLLLQRGASHVIAVEKGTQQLDQKLRRDPRVDSREKTDAMTLTPEALGGPIGFACADLSFTSAKPFLPLLARLLPVGAGWVILVKPQFEAAADEVEKGGIVRDDGVRERVLAELEDAAAAAGLRPQGHLESPLPGAKGNREWLLWGRR
jgi:23S rRNA (cytidine1920-2'-O)/16S rRNA (cytidine1409-2'-O)-methyltransferase